MTKTAKLKDQTEVIIRAMTKDDYQRSLAFFCAFTEADKTFLRRDVTNPKVVFERIFEIERGKVKRLMALVDDRIIAEAALELSGHLWDQHVAELRMVVARPYQRKGLGMLMARELRPAQPSKKS